MPPSRIGGGAYELVVDTTPWQIPEWIMRALDAKPVDVVSAYKRHHRAGRGPQGFEPIIATMAKAEEGGRNALPNWARSEEHTSELQSLMRISYAVFCLKKKRGTMMEGLITPSFQ